MIEKNKMKKLVNFIPYILSVEGYDMEELMHAAQAVDMAKSDFLARMSHEIRTPMNAICGMSELLMDEDMSEKGQEYASIIKSSGHTLLDIINDILDFSRLEAGKLPIVNDEYNPAIMFRDIVSMFDIRLRDPDITLKTEIDANIPKGMNGDEGRIRQVLVNLLGNAAKFTKQGSITIRANWEKLQEGMGNVRIEIQLKSKYGEGSTFIITLPQTILDETPSEYGVKKRTKLSSHFYRWNGNEDSKAILGNALMGNTCGTAYKECFRMYFIWR